MDELYDENHRSARFFENVKRILYVKCVDQLQLNCEPRAQPLCHTEALKGQ